MRERVVCSCAEPLRVAGSVKVTGLAQKLSQLEAVNRDLQSKSWANLKFLGQPCNFYAVPGLWHHVCDLQPVAVLNDQL